MIHRYPEDSTALSGDLRYVLMRALVYHYCCSSLYYSLFCSFGGGCCYDSVVVKTVVSVLYYVCFLDGDYMYFYSSQVLEYIP